MSSWFSPIGVERVALMDSMVDWSWQLYLSGDILFRACNIMDR